jgi:hypothetical protein
MSWIRSRGALVEEVFQSRETMEMVDVNHHNGGMRRDQIISRKWLVPDKEGRDLTMSWR